MFPIIKNIDDVLPHIANKPEFIVAERDGYKVINYTVAFEDSFEGDPVLRECRGIVFDINGDILSRRLHKFFNVNEKEETKFENLPWDKPYVIMDKLDGSMITALLFHGEWSYDIRWGTKMGLTDVAQPVEEYVYHNHKSDYAALAQFCHQRMNSTAIFEWCSNKQRIVIDHSEDTLVLLHVRNNVTGDYVDRKIIEFLGREFHVPIVKTWNSLEYRPEELLEIVKNLEGEEGVVVQFMNGDMVKIKSDWYIRIHRAKDKIATDRRLLECILNNELDDLLPCLAEADRERITNFEKNFKVALEILTDDIDIQLRLIQYNNVSRKDFALTQASNLRPIVKTTLFKFFDDRSRYRRLNVIEEFIIQQVRNHMSSEAKFDIIRKQMGF